MRSSLVILLSLLAVAGSVDAVVIRHDVDDTKYQVPDSAFPALADIPQEGHAVLIAPQWLVTAAHAVSWQMQPVSELSLDGKTVAIEKIIIHPGYKPMPPVPSSGDAAPFMRFLFERDDLALIKLKAPVTDVMPVPLYRGRNELGKVVTFFGKGATGNGLAGVSPHAPHRTRLRQGFNRVAEADGKWLGMVFDAGKKALPLEAKSGSGDSGGPLLIRKNGRWWLAGVTAQDYCEGDIAQFKPGFYGMKSYQVRISAYADWIEQTIKGESTTARGK